jgi:hypothetical protein
MNQGLTVIAPDGIYSFGTTTREQSAGVLLTAVTCAACGTPCGGTINLDGGDGLYKLTLDVGTLNTGAIIITFDVGNAPDGIRVNYNGVVYNKISSPNYGVRQATANSFTTIGSIGYDCGLSGNTTTRNYTVFNYDGTSFINSGTTESVTLVPADVFVQATNTIPFGVTKLVIPKPTSTPSVLFAEILGPCSNTGWFFKVFCPAALPTFPASNVFADVDIPCVTPLSNTFYFVKVHTANNAFVGLYDYVFTDVNGEFPLANGFYLTSKVAVPNQVMQVVNGVVIAITNCI